MGWFEADLEDSEAVEMAHAKNKYKEFALVRAKKLDREAPDELDEAQLQEAEQTVEKFFEILGQNGTVSMQACAANCVAMADIRLNIMAEVYGLEVSSV